ncbi:hypothetical protein VP01_3373g1 [Puccinia sorghi]|uniref:Uncharacterized protein n=1 Tax=Puccinia sorghi TaxID=27349 RepID=A0A0L6UWV0_9BASI|nr:hypothetical protein VP01_3373g1 [Puccinia sorghi]
MKTVSISPQKLQDSNNHPFQHYKGDSQTIISQPIASVDSKLIKTICCRACFKLYPDACKAPMFCTYQALELTQACKEALFIQKKTHGGIKDFGLFPPEKNSNIVPINCCVPRCLLVSQPISTWLTWLLSNPDIENSIDMWTHEIKKSNNFYQPSLGANTLSGDLPATQKVAGFASATATHFCLMCHVRNNQLAKLKIGPIREKYETLASVKKSMEAESANAQDAILKETGHVVLGIMTTGLKACCRLIGDIDGSLWHKAIRKRQRQGIDVNSTKTASSSTKADTEDTDLVLGGAMINVVLPSGLAKLPTNLGEERHGKLKAAQWYSLFAYIILLVIWDLYLENIENINTQSTRAKFIMNKAYLIQCTNVLFAREITGAQNNFFESNYKKYCDSVASLFADVKIQPNHHCSLHIPNQIRAWGPLPRVAKFTGERLIGGCQLQCLMDEPAYKVMIQEEPTKGRSYNQKKIKLTHQMYGKIYNYLVKTDPSGIHRDSAGRRSAEQMIHGSEIPLRSVQCDGFKVATTQQNNCVVAMIDGKVRYGIVKQIYSLEDRHHEGRKVIVLSPIFNLFPQKFNISTSRFVSFQKRFTGSGGSAGGS